MSEAPAPAKPDPQRVSPTLKIWAVTVAMGMLAGALTLALPPMAPQGVSWELQWWHFAIVFALSELTIIHIPVRRESHTISLSEIPLVVGMAFAAPHAVVLGRIVGSAAVLAFKRKNPPIKLAFNTSLFALEAAAAISAYRLLLGTYGPAEPRGWIAAVAAVAAAVVVSAGMVDVAITLVEQRRRFAEVVRSFSAGAIISLAAGFLGVVAVFLLWHEPWSVLLLAFASGLFFLLIRVYSRLSRRYDELQALYGFTSSVDAEDSSAQIVETTLLEVIDILRAEQAEFTWHDAQRGDLRRVVAARSSGTVTQAPPLDGSGELLDLAASVWSERSFAPRQTTRVATLLEAKERGGMITPVAAGAIGRGILAVIGRTGPERSFGPTDLELFDAIGRQLGLTLDRALVIDRLREEIDAKQEVIRSKDQLIAAVSHELRTPLTGVLGFAEMLRDAPDDYSQTEAHSMLSSIAAEALDLTNLVEDLLTAARAQMGSLTIAPGPVDLRALAPRVAEQFGGGAHLITVTGPNVVAHCDEGRVRQILRNLLSNALRYGGHKIHVATFTDGAGAYLRVSDNGDGIPENDQERIFAAYESAHDPGTQPGSLGLGLTISRSLARLMEGDLTYARRDGWTIFELVLPLSHAPMRSGRRRERPVVSAPSGSSVN